MAITRHGQMYRDDSNHAVGFNYYFQAFSASATFANIALQPGIFHTLTLDNPTSGNVLVYDGTSNSGKTIANITVSTVPVTLTFDVGFSTGLYITTTTGTPGNVTVSYISADK